LFFLCPIWWLMIFCHSISELSNFAGLTDYWLLNSLGLADWITEDELLKWTMDFNNWQLTVDSWQWNGRLADFWFLKTFSLNTFSLTVSIACHFQIALTPSALTPFILAVSIAYWGVASNPTSFFCLDTKKEAKKVKTAPVSLEKWSFGRLKSSNLLKFDDSFIKVKGHDTNFNFEQGRFLTAFLAYFSAHRPRIKKS
jgi:hypothetical protein